ncbi:MAG: hypothetical protein QOE35_4103 [Actinomycetota bacterium]|jgi:hypothetical protein
MNHDICPIQAGRTTHDSQVNGIRRLTVLAAVVLAGLAPTVAARAADRDPSGQAVADACRPTAGQVPEAGPRGCRTTQAVVWGSGQWCRQTGASEDVCATLDGRDLSEASIAAYEASWTHRALALQRDLDARVPLLRALVPHTHNSFNSAAYLPTLSGSDPNQAVSMANQLRLDMRGIEIDVHWVPSPTADPSDNGMAPIMCHGQPEAVGPVVVHAGCTYERHVRDGLAELRAWIDAQDAAGTPQLVLLYLENNLDGNEAAHNAVARTIAEQLGPRVLRPPAGQPCAPMPLARTRQDILATGARVLIVGNCGPGGWGTWVHERGPQWDESSSSPGDDYPTFPACEAERASVDYAHHWVRRYEDSTWLSAMASGDSSEVTVNETRSMVRCGVNMPGFDQLRASDPRLAQLVWSWAPNEPAAAGSGGDCAAQGDDARFHTADCGSNLSFACVDAAGAWQVTAQRGAFDAGDGACTQAFPGSHFAVPANGHENELVRRAAGAGSVWLNDRRSGDRWTPVN